MLAELFELESGLSAGQISFLDSMASWSGKFTERQAETIESIYREVM